MPKTVTIAADEYLTLLESDLTLSALQNAGVDNWDGYGEVDWRQVRADVAAAKAKIEEN